MKKLEVKIRDTQIIAVFEEFKEENMLRYNVDVVERLLFLVSEQKKRINLLQYEKKVNKLISSRRHLPLLE